MLSPMNTDSPPNVLFSSINNSYDNNFSVRAGSYRVLSASKDHVPKAWVGLFVGESDGETTFCPAATAVGMAWVASRGDPAAEVAKNASSFIANITSNETGESVKMVQQAACKYSKSILACKRASSLQDVINPTSVQSKSSGVNSKSATNAGRNKKNKSDNVVLANESEKEETEECYERVILSALSGLGWLVQCYPEHSKAKEKYVDMTAFPDSAYITRILQSSRGSFRREAYNVVGKFCQFAPSLIISESTNRVNLAPLIPNLLSSEKETSSISPLLEMILSFFMALRSDDGETQWEKMNCIAFTKSLSKSLRRACYGAPASVWCPIILPLVASLPRQEGENIDSPLPLAVVESLWEGRNEAISVVDKLSIVSAVIECVIFLLLRQSKDSYPLFSLQSWTKCGRLLIETLTFYLNGLPNVVGSAVAALDDLTSTISRNLLKLCDASSADDLKDRGVNQNEWLWEADGLQTIFVLEENQSQRVQRFRCLIDHILTFQQSSSTSHLFPSFRNLFRSAMSNISCYRDKTSNIDDGRLFLSILQCCGVNNLFPLENVGEFTTTISVEDFILNYLLRWILVHGSSSQRSSVSDDFKMLKLCLHSMTSVSRQIEIWETVLRELTKAYCDYTTISDGLVIMASYKTDSCFDCKCKVLDDFAANAATDFASSFRRSHDILQDSDIDEEPSSISRKGDLAQFFRTCVGLSVNSSGLLVSTSVVKQWIHSCCQISLDSDGNKILMDEDESGENVLLQTLLSLQSTQPSNILSNDEVVKLLLESWHEGGSIWSETSTNLLGSSVFSDGFVEKATFCICKDIKSQPPNDHSILELLSESWAKRAKKLLDISRSNSLDIVGLHDASMWHPKCQNLYGPDGLSRSHQSAFLFLCLMYLLHSMEVNNRQDLLFEDQNEKLFVHILCCVAETTDVMATSFESRTVSNQHFVDMIGNIPGPLLESCCLYSIDLISSLANDEASAHGDMINRALTSLTFLVSLLFSATQVREGTPEIEDEVNPTSVKEGESLWYEKAGGGIRVKAKVVKVHFDDFPDLYFTIRVDGSDVEKQTVAKKLKRYHTPREESLVYKDDSMTETRDQLGRCIVQKILQPYNNRVKEVAAECINVIISQCGFSAVGVGSVKYDVFKMVSSIENSLCDTLTANASEPSLIECIPLLRSLALSMGYGVYTIPSWKNVNVLKLDPGSITKLLDLYENPSWIAMQKSEPMLAFHSSVTMWLTVALQAITNEETYRRLLAVVRSLSDILLQTSGFASNSIYILNAAVSMDVVSHRLLVESDDEKEVLTKLARSFADAHNTVSSDWTDKFSSLLRSKGKMFRPMFLQAAKSSSNELVDCLFVPQKRWCAFQILELFASLADGESLEPDDSIIQREFAAWKEGMDDDETVELEDDIRAASSWVPAKMMSVIKSLGEQTSSADHEDEDMKGYFLTWGVCLNIMDTAGSDDMRNRSSIISFIKKSNVVGFIMEMALSEVDLGNDDNDDIFSCVELDSSTDFVCSDLALLVLFRTVEALPTLVKQWFNDDCPKYWQQKFSAFVEKRVAPTTLQRELDRIKNATCFDEMTVNGSCASREVVATYQQDEVRKLKHFTFSFPLTS